jgi:hypothetical protein
MIAIIPDKVRNIEYEKGFNNAEKYIRADLLDRISALPDKFPEYEDDDEYRTAKVDIMQMIKHENIK